MSLLLIWPMENRILLDGVNCDTKVLKMISGCLLNTKLYTDYSEYFIQYKYTFGDFRFKTFIIFEIILRKYIPRRDKRRLIIRNGQFQIFESKSLN